MSLDPQSTYFETQIITATPQKLRLMLIEGALRHARLTLDRWRTNTPDAGYESLVRTRDIVGELIAGIRTGESALTAQVNQLYVYLFSALIEAQQTCDEALLAGVIRALEEDRETWRQVCEQLGDRPAAASSAHFAPHEELAPAVVPLAYAFSIDA